MPDKQLTTAVERIAAALEKIAEAIANPRAATVSVEKQDKPLPSVDDRRLANARK